MVRVVIETQQNKVTGFRCTGHADPKAQAGHDVICAGISVLVLNTVNSIEELTDSRFTVDSADEEGGRIVFSFTEDSGDDAQLLLSSMILGLRSIRQTYGSKYLRLEFREV